MFRSVVRPLFRPTKPGRWRENAAILAEGPLPQEQIDAIREQWWEVAEPSWTGDLQTARSRLRSGPER